jgi:DsbC/DsbD-like thiol-disulfide interchange protein
MCATSQASEFASAWTSDKVETKSRLVAGSAQNQAMALVEITLADGWKTYWRFPGDAGGVPPTFDWARSDNVASAKVLYPAPERMTDKAGDVLGYKNAVAFPVVLEAKDATKPMSLRLTLEYGVCKDVCIPVEAELAVEVPVAAGAAPSPALRAALSTVPRTADTRLATDPKVLQVDVKLDGPNPSLTFDAEFPAGTTGADAFIEGPSGSYIPSPKAGTGKEIGTNRLRFAVDLTGAVDPVDIKGKFAMVTLVSKQGLSETTFKLE